MSVSALDLRFPQRLRLTAAANYSRVFAQNARSTDKYFTVLFAGNQCDHPRLGLAISRKLAGSAVRRNKIKRLVREEFRSTQHHLPAVDLVVMAREAACVARHAAIHASLQGHWRRVMEKCD